MPGGMGLPRDGPMVKASCVLPCADVERRKNPVCGFITPLEGSEADEHRKPEVGHGHLQETGLRSTGGAGDTRGRACCMSLICWKRGF